MKGKSKQKIKKLSLKKIKLNKQKKKCIKNTKKYNKEREFLEIQGFCYKDLCERHKLL